ncbi:MAG TPA: DUF1178 family protein [Sphingomicrobium sp.]|nr:DUF1178 family protein [Sphingomicrobium sp.]
MIVYDLQCADGGETFEAWFRSSADFDRQQVDKLIHCPMCGSANVAKAPMAPQVPRKGAGRNPLQRMADAQAELLSKSRWVGNDFAQLARAMHDGEQPAELVHGQTTKEEAQSLLADGVPVSPLPFPVIPPSQVN